MAQTNYTPISLYYSATASNVPTAANLIPGELAINTADGKLYYEDSAGVVQVLATKSTGSIGGSNTQVQFNNSGSLGGSSGLTWDGSFLTTSSIKNSALTSGRVTYAGASGLLSDSANLLYSGTDLTVYGLTVGRGGSSVSSNTIFGASAGASNTTGNNNVELGNQAGQLNTTGNENVYIGSVAGYNAIGSNNNVGVGSQALRNSTGGNNTAVGFYSLVTNTSGAFNVALGTQALTSNTTASSNTAVGYQAGYYLTGASNTAIGQQALYGVSGSSAGASNSALGSSAGYGITTGASNVMVGNGAGYGMTSASNSVCLGVNAGFNVAAWATGSNCVFIGYNSGASSTSVSNEMVITTGATQGKGASTGFINPNSGGVYQGNNSAAWSITSDARIKKNIVDNNTGLDKITAIQVRNFEYRLPEEITEVPQDQAIKKEGIQLGVIAQELQQVLPECVKTESTGVMTVDSDNLTWYMINAIKELKAEIDQLKGLK
jgi:hypothetical protein